MVLLTSSSAVYAQKNYTLSGTFKEAKSTEIRLTGYYGTKEVVLSQSTTDTLGNFTLNYPKNYKGASLLEIKERKSVMLLLQHENFEMIWSSLDQFDSLKFVGSYENQWFEEGYTINSDMQGKLAGLQYLQPLYKNSATSHDFLTSLENEIKHQSQRYNAFINQLPTSSYAKKYLAYRAVLQGLQTKNIKEEQLATAEKGLLGLDFGDKALYHSGLVKELFEEYLKRLMEKQDKEFITTKSSVLNETVKQRTKSNTTALNEYSECLIKLYEKYGQTEIAQTFALSLLGDDKCLIDDKRMTVLEHYRKMAIGNVAPNIFFQGAQKYKSLTDIKAKYKVVVFGASWCEACKEELPQLKDYAEMFKANYQAEIVFISLDQDKASYSEFIKELPFITSCDFKGWEGKAVKDYCVLATPSIYILDTQNKIVAKPLTSVDVAAWLYKN